MTTLNVRMDDATKREFELFCGNVGMSMTTAVNIFVNTVIKEQRIPFEISNDPFFSKDNMSILNQSIENMNAGKGVYKTLDQLEAMENE